MVHCSNSLQTSPCRVDGDHSSRQANSCSLIDIRLRASLWACRHNPVDTTASPTVSNWKPKFENPHLVLAPPWCQFDVCEARIPFQCWQVATGCPLQVLTRPIGSRRLSQQLHCPTRPKPDASGTSGGHGESQSQEIHTSEPAEPFPVRRPDGGESNWGSEVAYRGYPGSCQGRRQAAGAYRPLHHWTQLTAAR